MDRRTIIEGYQWVMNTLYSPEMYYRRILAFLQEYHPRTATYLASGDLVAFVRSLWFLGIADKNFNRSYYWRLLKEGFSKYRQAFSDVVTMSIYGYHFRKLFWSPRFRPAGRTGGDSEEGVDCLSGQRFATHP